MSGFEIVGLVLAVVSLAEPLKTPINVLASTAKRSDKFEYLINKSVGRLSYLRGSFLSLCIRLFSPLGEDEKDIREMFGDEGGNHPKWQDDVWKVTVREYLGSSYEPISESMREVLEEFQYMKKLFDKVSKSVKAFEEENIAGVNAKRKLTPAEKALWTMYEPKIKKHLDLLRDRLEDLKYEVDNFLRYARPPVDVSARKTKKANCRKWSDVSGVLQTSRAFSRRLALALQQNRRCGCHSMNVRLDFDLIGQLQKMQARGDTSTGAMNPSILMSEVFRFLIASTENKAGNVFGPMDMDLDGCCAIKILQELEVKTKIWAKPKRKISPGGSAPPDVTTYQSAMVPVGQVYSAHVPMQMLPSHLPMHMQSSSATVVMQDCFSQISLPMQPPPPFPPSSPLKERIKKVTFASIPSTIFKRKDPPEMPRPPQPAPALRPADPAPCCDGEGSDAASMLAQILTSPAENLPRIDNLCSLFSRLPFPSVCNDGALGYIEDGDELRHHFYDKPENYRNKDGRDAKLTLREFFADRTRKRFTTNDKLKLAYQLSSSLLQLHLNSWVKKSWRSNDVLLLENHRFNDDDDDSEWLPYALSGTDGGHASGTVPESYIYSLAIVLLEIGREEPMRNDQTQIDEMREAKEKLGRAKLKKDLGPTYQEVVSTCFDWNKSSVGNDLTDEDVQKVFFEEVVDRLKGCIDWQETPVDRIACV